MDLNNLFKILYAAYPEECWWEPTQTAYAVGESFTDSECNLYSCTANYSFSGAG